MTMLGGPHPSSSPCQGQGPISTVVDEFDQHLGTLCRLSAATRCYRRRYAREFLEWRFRRKRWDLTRLCFADFLAYVTFRAPRLQPASAGVMVSSLRPPSSSRRVFLCHRLPVGEPLTAERLRRAVRRALRRSGLTGSPHRLRHSFATRLHARGASLKEVADVLGHQHFDTMARYARVNLSQLRKVALPWPGARP